MKAIVRNNEGTATVTYVGITPMNHGYFLRVATKQKWPHPDVTTISDDHVRFSVELWGTELAREDRLTPAPITYIELFPESDTEKEFFDNANLRLDGRRYGATAYIVRKVMPSDLENEQPLFGEG